MFERVTGWVSRLTVAMGVLAAVAAHASSVIVPDDVPDVRTAIASVADTVWVRPGAYPDTLLIARSVLLASTLATGDSVPDSAPTIGSITIDPGQLHVTVRGIHVGGHVFLLDAGIYSAWIVFDQCRIDSDVFAGGSSNYVDFLLRRCVIGGGMTLYLYYPEVSDNLVRGPLMVWAHGTGTVRNNVVTGPARVGIRSCCSDGNPQVTGNRISGVDVGIVAYGGSTVRANTFQGCSINGIRLGEIDPADAALRFTERDRATPRKGPIEMMPFTGSRIDSNWIEDSGLDGIEDTGSASTLTNNVVLRSGRRGIDAPGAYVVSGNRVLGSAAEGLVVSYAACRNNVVGRSGADGIVSTWGDLTNNTSYANLAAGFRVASDQPVSVSNNIGYANGTFGLAWSGAGVPALGCNDWYQNGTGTTDGAAQGATDLELDPMFCNVANDSVGLHSDSPLLNAATCGLIGALGMECVDQATQTLTPGDGDPQPDLAPDALALLQPSPSPAVAATQIAFTLPAPANVRLEILDVSGRQVETLVSGPIVAGRHAVLWAPPATLPAGVYFATLQAGGARMVRRVSLLR